MVVGRSRDANPERLPPVRHPRIMAAMDEPGAVGNFRSGGRTSRQAIADELRRRIREGVYPPGSRIPTQVALAGEFGISSVTLQRAIDQLAEFGLVEPRGRLGTFVCAAERGGGNVALVFADQPNQGSWNRFLGNVRRSGESCTAGALRYRPYFIDQSRSGCPAAQQLLADATAGALDGLVFVFAPWYLDERLFALPLPRLIIGGVEGADARYRATLLRFAWDTVRDQVLAGFVRAGCRRLASLHPRHGGWDLAAKARAAGLETRAEWHLPFLVDSTSAACARTVAHLLCSRPAAERPDCLLVEDDNLVPHATAGVLDAGLAPGDITVAAHANFPDVTRAAFPCQRYGLDVDQIVATALAEIAVLAAGGPLRTVEVAAVFRGDAR